MRLVRTALAFLRKDLLEETSYRLNFVSGIAMILLTLVFFTFVSDFFGPLVAERLDEYGGDYFAFVVLGVGMLHFLTAALHMLTQKIRRAQTLGTLEALLVTPTGLPTILFCLPLYTFLQTVVRVLGYLLIGQLLFGMTVHWGNWPAALVIFALMITAFGSMGVALAGLTIAFKRTGPITTGISTLCLFFGGIYYPLSVMPDWVRAAAQVLPITPALEGMRKVLLAGGGWADVLPDILALLAFVAVALPLSALVFRWTLRRAMRDGTLTQY